MGCALRFLTWIRGTILATQGWRKAEAAGPQTGLCRVAQCTPALSLGLCTREGPVPCEHPCGSCIPPGAGCLFTCLFVQGVGIESIRT